MSAIPHRRHTLAPDGALSVKAGKDRPNTVARVSVLHHLTETLMRIEAQSKLGYYPTPDTQLPLILTWLQLPAANLVRVLDPCCGKGEALAYLAHGLGKLTTYGIELSYSHAKRPSDFSTTSWRPDSRMPF